MEITLPAEFQRQIVIAFLTLIALAALSLYVAYLILKWAVRDAIKESGLVEALRRATVTSSTKADAKLPDMRAD